jgi:hypothetical protein
MRRSGTGSGGGIGMNKNVRPSVRTGSGARGTHPGGVAQLGQHVGDKATHGKSSGSGYRGEPLHNNRNFNPVKYGNELATNIGKGGPGTGRTLYGQSGSQGCHGQPAQGEPGLPSTRGQWPDKR